ncbi:hypothetical protein [Brevibacillus laterosporus]|uniref:hypothetical protein n=1 Tax=Brevibacillus laterosporus TaxID=1465 RepID=UPI0018CC9CE7|nr:hypothetical protein [Brevibacillus laterosporus]MBG9788718.1 hypothetical protein [Brevibacillus laterosporus]
MLKMKVMFDNGDVRLLTDSSGRTFAEIVRDFYSARYYMFNDKTEVGNCVIDTHKVCTIEIVGVSA